MRVVAVDIGQKRLGFAVSDPDGCLALPCSVIDVHDDDSTVMAIVDVCRDKEATCLVVGMPISMSGNKGPMACRIEALTRRIAQELSIPVETWDERLTTVSAERAMRDAGWSGRKLREDRDKIAAQIILQAFLDSRAASDWSESAE